MKKEMTYVDYLCGLMCDVESDYLMDKADQEAAVQHLEALQQILYKYSA